MSDDTERRGRTTFIAAFLVVALFAFTPVLRAQVPPCGDGTLDIGEECDEGPATGTAESCCAIDCTFRPASTPCRVAVGACDVDDVCSGTSGVCDDAKSTDVCRPAAGVCDVAESCDGVSNDCPADGFAAASVECRPAAGVCDVAEQCTGSAAACPVDAKSTAVCRPSAGVCDVAESCDGVADACPADAFATASVTCRSAAGVCDVVEHCTGSGAACPADAKSTAVCRPSAGVCDVAESCDGVANACPADGFVSAGVECRAATGVCDVAEQCTGSSAACPTDGFAPDETSCDDANSCSINDRCVGGVCGGFLQSCGNGTTENGCFEECDDGNTDPGDGCDATCHLEPCGPEPIPGCRLATVAGKAGILVLSRLNPEKNKLQWKYSPGDTTPKSDFGNPLTTTSYDLCLFEQNAGDSRLAARYAIPAGGTCGSGPCWRESSSGFKYTDKAHASDGISSVVMKQGLAPGKTKIILSGKGANLPLPVLPLVQSPDVVMQLRGSNGICWETRFVAPAVRNQPDQFRDK